MKKNHVMRISAIVLALVLATACLVSGTFAKYVTAGATKDSARVADWGVTLDISNSQMFTNEYAKDNAYSQIALTVQSKDGARVVAPGTNSGEDIAPIEFSISGTPEVATRVDFICDVKDIFLEGNVSYTDWTKLVEQADGTFAYTDTYLNAERYYPVEWTLTQIADANGATNSVIVENGTLADIKAAIDAFSGVEYAPNTCLDAKFRIDWKWDFEQGKDQQDTTLGNLAAGVETNIAADLYNLEVAFDLGITVTQVD